MRKTTIILLLFVAGFAKGQTGEFEKNGVELGGFYTLDESRVPLSLNFSYVSGMGNDWFMKYGIEFGSKSDLSGLSYIESINVDFDSLTGVLPNTIGQFGGHVSGNYKFSQDGEWIQYVGGIFNANVLRQLDNNSVNRATVNIFRMYIGVLYGANYMLTENLYINGEVSYIPFHLFNEEALLITNGRFTAISAGGSDFNLINSNNLGIRIKAGYYFN